MKFFWWVGCVCEKCEEMWGNCVYISAHGLKYFKVCQKRQARHDAGYMIPSTPRWYTFDIPLTLYFTFHLILSSQRYVCCNKIKNSVIIHCLTWECKSKLIWKLFHHSWTQNVTHIMHHKIADHALNLHLTRCQCQSESRLTTEKKKSMEKCLKI